MRKFIGFFAVVGLACSAAADGGAEYYAGMLDGKLEIQMTLTRGEQEIAGTYFYMKRGTPIDLSGTVQTDGSFSLTETVDEKDTGTFQGKTLDGGRKLEGTWTNADASRTLPFALTRFATGHSEERTVKVKGQSIDISESYPVFDLGGGEKEKALNEAVKKRTGEVAKALLKDARGMVDSKVPDSYEIDVYTDVAFFAPSGLASFDVSIYAYTGGAHGMSAFDCLNLRLDGPAPRPLGTLKDILQPGEAALMKLSALVLADLKQQEASSVVDGTVSKLGFDELKVYTLSPGGLTFYFGPYAVGSYVEGPYEVTLPLSKLGDILKAGVLQGIGLVPAK